MSKKLFKKASSRVRECNHNSCVRNNVLLFSLHKFHYAWVFLFFLYVKHVLRALILLSLQHCSHPNVWMFLTLLRVSLHCPNQLLLVVFIPFEIFCEIACQPLTDWQETKIGHPLIMWSPPPPSLQNNKLNLTCIVLPSLHLLPAIYFALSCQLSAHSQAHTFLSHTSCFCLNAPFLSCQDVSGRFCFNSLVP